MFEDKIQLLSPATPSEADNSYGTQPPVPFLPGAAPSPEESMSPTCGNSVYVAALPETARCYDMVNGERDYHAICSYQSGTSTVCITPNGARWQLTQVDSTPDPDITQALVPQGYTLPQQEVKVHFLGYQPSTPQFMLGAYLALAMVVPLVGMLWWALRANADKPTPALTKRQRLSVNGYYKQTQRLLDELAPYVMALLPGEAVMPAAVDRFSKLPLHTWKHTAHSQLSYKQRLYTQRQLDLFDLVYDLLDFECGLADMLDISECKERDFKKIKSHFLDILNRSKLFVDKHLKRNHLSQDDKKNLYQYFKRIQDILAGVYESSPIVYLKETRPYYDDSIKLYIRLIYSLCLVSSFSQIEKLEQDKVYLKEGTSNNIKYMIVGRDGEKIKGSLGIQCQGKLTQTKLVSIKNDILQELCEKEIIPSDHQGDVKAPQWLNARPFIQMLNIFVYLQMQCLDYLQTDLASNEEISTLKCNTDVLILQHEAHSKAPRRSTSSFFSAPASSSGSTQPSSASASNSRLAPLPLAPSKAAPSQISPLSLPRLKDFFNEPLKPICSSRDTSHPAADTSGKTTSTLGPAASK
jgi:hypothetical protein